AFTFETGGLWAERGASRPDCAVGAKIEEKKGLKGYSAHQRGSMENVLAVLNLGDLAQAFSKMGMFPVFDLAYYIVSILYLKYEPGSVEVSRRSPVASWLCAMLYCFGSYILADIMLGSSPVDYFQYNSHILLASAV
ncbi:Trimeric intracellular cation channel type A, partial [Xenoophorus captivus]